MPEGKQQPKKGKTDQQQAGAEALRREMQRQLREQRQRERQNEQG